MSWSKPYYNTQHLGNVRAPFQCTVTHYGRFSEVTIWDTSKPWSGFTEEHQIFKVGAANIEPDWPQSEDPPAAIREWAEARVRTLGFMKT